jgi:hypothetical protein
VAGGGFYHDCQSGRIAPEPLRAQTEGVDLRKKVGLDGGVKFVGVGFAEISQQGLFAQKAAHLEIAAYADSHDKWRAGIGAGRAHNVNDPGDYVLLFRGGLKHFELALILAASSFCHDGELEFVAWYDSMMNYRGRIRAGIRPFVERIANDAFSQESLFVSGGDAGVYRIDQYRLPPGGDWFDGEIGALLGEDHGQARILAERYPLLGGQAGVLY